MLDVRINAREVLISLQADANVVRDLTPFWNWLVVNRLRPAVANVFTTEGYGRWAPRKGSPLHPPLRFTNRLFDSLTSQTPDTEIETTPTSLKFGTTVDYSQYHEFGTSRIPARPFLSILLGNQSFISRLDRDLQNYLDNRLSTGR